MAEIYNNYQNSSRNKYWCEPPSYLPGTYPESGLPRHQESLRTQLIAKENSTLGESSRSLKPFLSRSQNFRAKALDTRRLTTDFRVQDFVAPVGVRKNLPTNVPEKAKTIHVNSLRFQRDADYTGSLPRDGGANFSDEVCVSNWVEERRDKSFVPSFRPKDVRTDGLYDTEYTVRFSPNTEEYREKLTSVYAQALQQQSRSGGASLSKSGASLQDLGIPRAKKENPDLVGYMSDGFGITPFQDHTAEDRRGNFWVGTAPSRMYESISATAARRDPLEFQRRCAEDPKSKILLNTRPLPELTDKTLQWRNRLMQTQERFTTLNRSVYRQDFRDHRAARDDAASTA